MNQHNTEREALQPWARAVNTMEGTDATPDWHLCFGDERFGSGFTHTALYTGEQVTALLEAQHPAPAPEQTATAVPAGWKLVPVEPTPEMLSEGSCAQSLPGPRYISEAAAKQCWINMLAAAPASPPAQTAPQISTEHGPWLPSSYDEGETYCKRCLTRSVFADKRACDPHIVYPASPPAQAASPGLTDEQIEALVKDIHDAIAELAGCARYPDLTEAIDTLARAALTAPSGQDAEPAVSNT